MTVNRCSQGTLSRSEGRRTWPTVPICPECQSLHISFTHVLIFLQAYGDAGVVKIIKILEREIVYGMQLLGAAPVDDLVPELVGARALR